MKRVHLVQAAIGLLSVGCCVLLCGCEPSASAPPRAPSPAVQAAADVLTPPIASNDAAPPVAAPPAAAQSESEVTVKILDYDGIQQLIASHRGQVVVMDGWSTSCAPCLREFPHLVELHNRYDRDDLACVSLSFDFEGLPNDEGSVKPENDLPRVLKFLQRKQATFDNILSSDDSDSLRSRFQLASIPAVFVYDRQGKLRKRFDNEEAEKNGGPFTYEQVATLVAELVKEPR